MHCKYCQREAKSLNSNAQHEIRCKSNLDRMSLDYLKDRTMQGKTEIPTTTCAYCDKEYTNRIGLGNHTVRCPSNPNRVIQVMTAEGKDRVRANNLMVNQRWNDPAVRQQHSQTMKMAVERNPDAYTGSNRGRTKQIIVDGIKLQGQWEVDFYMWAKAKDLDPKRPTQSFRYEWNGTRSYFPDFYIESLDIYVEVKGYETDRDRAKWLQFPEKLRIIKEAEIKQIRQGIFMDL